jgi:hypothetical protein
MVLFILMFSPYSVVKISQITVKPGIKLIMIKKIPDFN